MSCDVRNIAIIFFCFFSCLFVLRLFLIHTVAHTPNGYPRPNDMDLIYALYSRFFFVCLLFISRRFQSAVFSSDETACVCARQRFIIITIAIINLREKYQPKRSAQSEWLEMCKIRHVFISLLFSSSFCKKKNN